MRLTYNGRIAEQNTNLMRNAGVAGVLNRSLSRKANLVNALQLAADRGWDVEERHEKRETHIDSIRLELEYGCGLHGRGRRGDCWASHDWLQWTASTAKRRWRAPHVPEERRRPRRDRPRRHRARARTTSTSRTSRLGRKEPPVAPDHPLEAVSVVETDTVSARCRSC